MGLDDSDKITRGSGDTLTIKLTVEEENYRAKYLPDPTKLTDEKLVCTVCSVSLAREIHQGQTVHVHRALKVLVCEACFTFYGDGCFSTDEDGDDKYCRWCGQGGTLFLCSKCNCAFCQKCVKQNLKSSVLADLEKDDWKCYFCIPRPLFGCRTICWGALELNKIGIQKEKEKLKKQKERLQKMEARKQEREEQLKKLQKLDMSSEDEQSTKKRKSRANNSNSSSSDEVMPAKKTRSSEGRGHVNGSIDRSRRKRKDSSSGDDDSDNKNIASKLRTRNKKTKNYADSSSEDQSDVKSKSKAKIKQKTSKESSDVSDEDSKSKRKFEKKKKESSDDESSDEKQVRKKKLSRRKKNDSDSSSDNKPKKKNIRKKKKDSSDDEKSDDDQSKKRKKTMKKKNQTEDSSDDSDDTSKKDKKKVAESKKRNDDSDDDSKKSRKNINDKSVVDGKTEEIKSKGNEASGDNPVVRKRIKLAVLWLRNAVKDISELGTLISIRATKFGKKKINSENLKTYDDVLNAVSKLKQLMSGIHSNYEHLEKGLEAQLKPWKILTGLEESDKDRTVFEETKATVNSKEGGKEVMTSEICHKTAVETAQEKSNSEKAEENNETDDMVMQWIGLSADEDSNEQEETKSLISKAKETLDKEDIMNGESGAIGNDSSKDKGMKRPDHTTGEVSETDVTAQSLTINESDNSESVLNQSENDFKDSAQTVIENNGEEGKKQKQEKSINSKERKVSHSGSDTDMFDTNEVFSSTQVIHEEGGDCSENESKKEKRIDSHGSASERKSESQASVDACQRSLRAGTLEHSSDNEFDLFSKKLQNKWESEDNMNLKTSLGIDSSGDSDVEVERSKGKEKNSVLRKKSCKEKMNEKSSEKMIVKSEDEDEEITDTKNTPSNSDSKVKDVKEKDKHDKPKRTSKVKETNKSESEQNNKVVKLEKSNVLTSDEDSEKEDNKKDKDEITKRKRNKEDSTKDQKNKSRDKKKKHKKDRTSSDIDDTDKTRKAKEDKKKDSQNKKHKKEDIKKQSKKENPERKNTLTSDESEEEVIQKDSNAKTKINHNMKTKKSSVETKSKSESSNRMKKHKNNRNLSSSEDSEDDANSNINKKVEKNTIKEKPKNEVNVTKENIADEKLDEDMEDTNKKSPNKNNESRESSEEKEKSSDCQNEDLCVKSEAKSELNEDSDIGDLTKDKIQDLNTSEECIQLDDSNQTNEFSTEESSKLVKDEKTKDKNLKRKSKRNESWKKNLALLDSSDEEDLAENLANSPEKENSDMEEKDEEKDEVKDDEKEDADYVRSPSLINLSSGDSSDSEIITKKKRKPKSSSESDAGSEGENKKGTKKRKRIKMADSSSDEASGSDEGNVKVKRKRKSSVGESPGKGGRKNIKKIKGKDDLEEATKEAAEEEKERRRRVEERQKLFNQVFEVKEAHTLDKLVLDFDPKEKKELLSVNKTLVSKMKPHQAKGVKFMWDSCFESISEVKKKKGSGCILAHCMGLGKTFQVISLVHTLLTNSEEIGVHTVMVVCPLSTVLNWYNEFDKWLQDVEGGDEIEVFHLTKCKQNPERARELRRWQHNGGVLIMGYEMFRNLAAESKKFRAKMKKDFQETLIDPGADLIVCDEGHMLKNEQTALSKAMTKVKTLRRIILTGTPMQNNLSEYHCMVQFVKPNLLGTRKEFLNRFVNPITNGQFVDSTDSDVKVMKRRAHVLHKMLEGLVQRFDYNVLTPFLPPKHEYVISVCLSELQIKLYQHYLQNYSQQSEAHKGGARLFKDWQALGRIWTHPRVLKLSSDKANLLKEKKALMESDSEGSLKDFIDDGSESETSEESDASSFASDKSDGGKKNSKSRTRGGVSTRSTRSNKNFALLESSDDEAEKKEEDATAEGAINDAEWWSEFIEPKHLDDINLSGKLVLLFGILKECEMIEDKILVFSQSLFSLDLIEYFLDKIDQATQDGRVDETLGNHQGNWSKGLDYFRLDGSTSSENRSIWCSAFNREDNPRARLFLISTRAGGLGINLTAANRVIIFDASWNPSHDVQSIFRIYRFGQKKPCYVYRFIAHGTMEEKVYDRQVAKQSISNRVVDEQQVHRHFSSNDLNELYSFTPPTKKDERTTPALPRDVLFAEILKEYSEWIEKYHEHDSLLENVIEEELNEEERKLAWEDYENDKKRGFVPATSNTGTVNPMSYQIEYLRQQLKAQYPNKSEQELNQILVYQVSLLMRQQQMKAQMQQQQGSGMGMVGNMGMPMAQGSMMPFANQMQGRQLQQQQQMYADYQKKMQQANLARLQLQQMQYQQQQQSVLQAQLTHPPAAMSMPKSRAIEMLLQNYQASSAQGPKDTSKSNPSIPKPSS